MTGRTLVLIGTPANRPGSLRPLWSKAIEIITVTMLAFWGSRPPAACARRGSSCAGYPSRSPRGI